MTDFLRFAGWVVLLASVHKQPGWVIILVVLAAIALECLKRRAWMP
jgi:hypothetical protein